MQVFLHHHCVTVLLFSSPIGNAASCVQSMKFFTVGQFFIIVVNYNMLTDDSGVVQWLVDA